MKRQITIHISIVLLLSATLGTIEAAPGESNGGQSEDKIGITRLINVISISPYEEKMRRAEVDQAIAKLRAMGDEAIEPLMDELQRSDNVYLQHRTVSLLQSIGTSKARESLLRIALGQDSPRGIGFGSSWAARNYVKILQDRSDAKKLLASKNPDVLGIALKPLQGVPVDTELFKRLEQLLQYKDYYLRVSAAKVIAADPEATLVRQKVSAIVRSLETVEKLPKAREKFQYDRLGTLADNVYYKLIRALSRIKQADTFLQGPSEQLQGKPRMCIIIARAYIGDASVKTQLCNIIEDPDMVAMPMMRLLALRAFGRIGNTDDLPFLRRIVETDPLEVADFGGRLYELVNGKVVITGNAMGPMLKPSDPWYIKPRRDYPIRGAAQDAIELIERKSK